MRESSNRYEQIDTIRKQGYDIMYTSKLLMDYYTQEGGKRGEQR